MHGVGAGRSRRRLGGRYSRGTVSQQTCLARQPILDRANRVFAYELLFRSSGTLDVCPNQDDQSSARVISDAVLEFGLDALTQGKLAFINITRELLLEGLPAALPPKKVVIELLETIDGDAEVVAACQAFRRAGYAIALDDFIWSDRTEPLVAVADYIKVDVLQADAETRRRLLATRRSDGPALLAEKVETLAQFDAARTDGFAFFQGYFFGRPIMQHGRPTLGHQAGHLRLLSALQDPDLTLAKLEALIQHDPSLCYRVLRTVNSASFAQARTIDSIRQALLLLGVDTVKRWASLWAMAGLSETSHPELMVMSTVRARCCELLFSASRGPAAAPEGFLLGLCSLLDAILERPIESILDHLPLSASVRGALRGEDNEPRRLLECAIAFERGDWDRAATLARRAGVSPAVLAAAHQDALRASAQFQKAA